MGIIKKEDIVGYHFESGEVICTECIEAEELENLKQSQIITADQVKEEDAHYFCDRCEEEIC